MDNPTQPPAGNADAAVVKFERLIERLEKATAPDHELDVAIALAAFHVRRSESIRAAHLVNGDCSPFSEGISLRIVIEFHDTIRFYSIPRYTEKLSDSMKLWSGAPPEIIPSKPIPNCIAALKARAALPKAERV